MSILKSELCIRIYVHATIIKNIFYSTVLTLISEEHHRNTLETDVI